MQCRRRLVSGLVRLLCSASAALGLLILGFVLYFLVVRGIGHLHLTLFLRLPDAANREEGGMLNGITSIMIGIIVYALWVAPLALIDGARGVTLDGIET